MNDRCFLLQLVLIVLCWTHIYIYILMATQNPIFVAMILSDYVKDFSIYVIVYK